MSTTEVMADMTDRGDEPLVTFPTTTLITTVVGATVVIGVVWAIVGWLLGRPDLVVAGFAGCGVVALTTAAGVVAITPWKPRPMSLWISIWLGQTVLRMLVTPVVAFLLYSSTSLAGWPFLLAVGVSYLGAVVSEAAILARTVRRYGPSTGGRSSGIGAQSPDGPHAGQTTQDDR